MFVKKIINHQQSLVATITPFGCRTIDINENFFNKLAFNFNFAFNFFFASSNRSFPTVLHYQEKKVILLELLYRNTHIHTIGDTEGDIAHFIHINIILLVGTERCEFVQFPVSV